MSCEEHVQRENVRTVSVWVFVLGVSWLALIGAAVTLHYLLKGDLCL